MEVFNQGDVTIDDVRAAFLRGIRHMHKTRMPSDTPAKLASGVLHFAIGYLFGESGEVQDQLADLLGEHGNGDALLAEEIAAKRAEHYRDQAAEMRAPEAQ